MPQKATGTKREQQDATKSHRSHGELRNAIKSHTRAIVSHGKPQRPQEPQKSEEPRSATDTTGSHESHRIQWRQGSHESHRKFSASPLSRSRRCPGTRPPPLLMPRGSPLLFMTFALFSVVTVVLAALSSFLIS